MPDVRGKCLLVRLQFLRENVLITHFGDAFEMIFNKGFASPEG